MANIRVIYSNAGDRATLVASSTAGSLAVTNLQKDTKAAIWRSTSTSATVTASWTTGEVIGGVALPFCNLTPYATIRVRGYTNPWDTSTIFDTGTIFACPPANLGLIDWGNDSLGINAYDVTNGVNGYNYGGGSYARAWITSPANVRKLVIDLVDSGNTAGYLEVSRLVCGQAWEPSIGPVEGATMTFLDTSKHYRTDAGDQYTDTGTKHRKQSFSLPSLDAKDRTKMWDILRVNGMSKPIFISVYPGNADVRLEQSHQLYGKLLTTPIMNTPYFNHQSATVDIEEI